MDQQYAKVQYAATSVNNKSILAIDHINIFILSAESDDDSLTLNQEDSPSNILVREMDKAAIDTNKGLWVYL